ncbi:MAG: hypothetical protein P8Z40_03190 [Chloroflexota bacterium]
MLPTNPKTNPVFQRLTRHPNAPLTLQETALLAGGLGFLVLTIRLSKMSVSLLLTPWYFEIAAWLLYPFAPLIGATMAASITGRDASTDLHQLMRQTPVARTDIVWGYIFTTFYRLRALLALMVALLPALLFGGVLGIPYIFPHPGIRLVLAIGLWGAILFGVVVGVSEGLLHKKVFPGVVAAPFGVTVILVPLAFTGRSLFYLLSEFPMAGATLGFVVIMSILIVWSPYLLSLLFFRLASRWA